MILMERAGRQARLSRMRRIGLLAAMVGLVAVAACGNDSDDDTTAVTDNGSATDNGTTATPDDNADSPAEDAPLTGTRWTVDALSVADVATESVSADTGAFVVIEEGEIRGDTGCNTFGGDAVVGEGVIEVAQVIATKRACSDELGDLDRAVLTVLRDDVTVEVSGDMLTLTNADGDRLELRADGNAEVDAPAGDTDS